MPHPAHAPDTGRIVILGAGPCGLACTDELTRFGHRDFLLLESASAPGGLASTPPLRNIAGWLRPGGCFVATTGHGEWTGTEED